jgi:hypothetical protein
MIIVLLILIKKIVAWFFHKILHFALPSGLGPRPLHISLVCMNLAFSNIPM